jgi:predicted ATPase/class 3 adenylate cyclase/DNA-binding CsgD family transcriptional regulator
MLANMSERADTPLVNWSELAVSGLLPTGTVTLLLADVEGSTRLWETQPDEMTAALTRLNQAVSDTIAAHDGVRPIEQGEGDSFVAAFARASDAVACALELQQAPLAPIRLRIGLHTGQVQLRDEGNYAGPTINRTARLRDLAHGGQTVLSGATEQLVVDWLPTDAWMADLGTHQLRDLPRPERVMQLCHPDIRNDFPPLRTSRSVDAHNLPAQLTSFVGRTAQMADVRDLLGDNRLVTLTGAGGAGKTRLAVEIADRIAADFRDGVRYVDLAPITHPAVVPVAVARALGLPDQPGRSTIDTLVRFVGDRQMLIVLDNCEHLLDATSSLVVELLGVCPGMKLLTTSREPTGVAGEVTFLVPSLSLGDEAIELFADRARRVRPEFALTDGNLATVTEICRRLDGMPLAIELAAARVRALSPEEILGGLHDRFRLLTGGARTAVRRQQTLRASVDWSHALLTEPERILFRRLAVFMGGFDLDAAQAVAGGTDVERYQVLDQLALLVDKSLVIVENSSGATRYRLLETVRQYALEKLGESGDAVEVRSRHRDHYVSVAGLLDEPARTEYQRRLEQAEIEIDNLRAALGWSRENGDAEQALQLVSSLQPLWLARGRIQEGLSWFNAVQPHEMPDQQVSAPVRVRAIADKVVLDGWAGIYNMADAEQALDMARQLDDPALLARALYASGCAAVFNAKLARPYFAEARDLARALGDPWRLSQILGRQAHMAFIAGDPVETRATAEEGRQLADAIGDRFESRQCRWRLSAAQFMQGDLVGAIAELRDLLAAAEADHDEMLRVTILFIMPHWLAYHGDAHGARAAVDAALEAAAGLGDLYMGASYIALIVVALAAGDVALAVRAADTARSHMGEFREAGAINMTYHAHAALACGDLPAAQRFADEAAATMTGYWLAYALAIRARVAIARGAPDEAERDAHEALASAAALNAYLCVPHNLECLAGLATEDGRHAEAARLFGAAEAIRHRTGEVRFQFYQSGYEAQVAALHNAMRDTEFEAAWAEGAALTADEAIAYAQRGRGERKRPARGWASLTPAELDVVRLIRDGLTNNDIATRLFVSPRTVQSHLTHVYTKLGLTSRVQLAQEAARHES